VCERYKPEKAPCVGQYRPISSILLSLNLEVSFFDFGIRHILQLSAIFLNFRTFQVHKLTDMSVRQKGAIENLRLGKLPGVFFDSSGCVIMARLVVVFYEIDFFLIEGFKFLFFRLCHIQNKTIIQILVMLRFINNLGVGVFVRSATLRWNEIDEIIQSDS